MDSEISAKVVVIGPVGVGKSSITIRYVHNEFHESLDSTLGAVYFEKMHLYKNKKIKFEFWDTAGQQKYKAIARIYYKECKIALIVYDVNKKESFEDMKTWVNELKTNGPENVIMAVIGNKIDLENSEVTSYEEAKKYADQLGALFHYTSAKDGKGIQELFNLISEKLMESKVVPTGKKEKLKKNKTGRNSCC